MAHPVLRQRAAQFVAWCLSKTVARDQELPQDRSQWRGLFAKPQDPAPGTDRQRELWHRNQQGGARHGR